MNRPEREPEHQAIIGLCLAAMALIILWCMT